MEAVKIKNSEVKKIKKVLKSGTMFVNKYRAQISEFLNEGNRYKVFKFGLTRNSCKELTVACSLYIDGQTHHYLKELTGEELQRCMKELGSNVTISLDEKVKK